MLPTVLDLQKALAAGTTTSLDLIETALARIEASDGEGSRTFTKVYQAKARAAARASDVLRSAGLSRSLIDGLPISIKDLFDIAGETTLAGSRVLKGQPAAQQNALAVQRLIDAGAVIVGRTNMTEFASSSLGLNPHYGTPSSPWDRHTRRIPGGSSSGAGVSVADGMAVAALGTDTGGSVRIPAAFCGLVGFKPTAGRIPTAGAFPISFTLDSVGPLAASVSCCAILDAIMARQHFIGPSTLAMRHLRFAIPSTVVLNGLDAHVNTVFQQAVGLIEKSGALVDVIELPEFGQLDYINRHRGFSGAEAWIWHRHLLEKHAKEYDPRVSSRILRGKDVSAADYIELLQTRKTWMASVGERLRPYDALLMPTVPIIAPSIKELEDSDEAYFAALDLIRRNSALINFLDGCALSIPCQPAGTAPVGLTIAGTAYQDPHIFEVGLALEKTFQID